MSNDPNLSGYKGSIGFSELIQNYKKIQENLVDQVRRLASKGSAATPASFILLQFRMSQVTQMGESISNLISQVNSVCNSAIRNQKPQ